MKGTDLKPLPTGVQWTIGSTAEVTWNVMFNHGGGYSYRLCPADEPLTEACFQQGHLEFVQVRRGSLGGDVGEYEFVGITGKRACTRLEAEVLLYCKWWW